MARWTLRMIMFVGVTSLLAGAVSAQYGDYGRQQPATGGTDLKAELTTARTHANNAAGSEALRNVQSHLTHVVNCLEGKTGRNYNQAEGNPCEGQGSGIIPDLRGAQGGAAWMAVAEAAADLALKGSKLTDMTSARNAARGAAALLGTAADGLR